MRGCEAFCFVGMGAECLRPPLLQSCFSHSPWQYRAPFTSSTIRIVRINNTAPRQSSAIRCQQVATQSVDAPTQHQQGEHIFYSNFGPHWVPTCLQIEYWVNAEAVEPCSIFLEAAQRFDTRSSAFTRSSHCHTTRLWQLLQ